MAHNEEHNKLVRDALETLALAGYCAWKNETGVWFDKSDEGRPHKYGKKGSADIFCILPVNTDGGHVIGMHCEFEAKTGTSVQSKNQKLHQKFVVEKNGGLYILFRSVEELMRQLKSL